MTSDPSPVSFEDSSAREVNPSGPHQNSRMVDGQRRVITILFCDVVSSTSLASQLDPEEWAEVMNEAFQYMIAPIQEYEGMVARLMGDAVLAFFGAPKAHEDDPQRAVLAGLAIVNGMRPFMKQFHQDYGLEFDVRVGINTGPVVVGEIGSNLMQEYTAMGDAINLAARMEQTALPGTVQISEDTYKLVAPIFDVYDLGKIDVKGKDEPVPAYRVLDILPGPGRLRGIDGLEAQLVGRNREMARLKESLVGMTAGKSRIAFVLGEAGLGKSRLVAELRKEWRLQQSKFYPAKPPFWNAWIEFVAVSYGTSRPYDMLKRQLRKFYSIRESDSPVVIAERLHSLTSLYPNPLQERLQRYFGFLLGNTLPESGPLPEGETFKRELRSLLTEAAMYQTEQGPIVYVIDDLHWADPASIDALRDLFTLVTTRPIFFLLALRPDWNSPGWQLFVDTQLEFPDQCVSIFLEPLSREDGRALIGGLLGEKAPPRVVDAIQQKAEGNPLFIEEVARALYDNGIVTRVMTGPEWQSQESEPEVLKLIGLPGNVQALMTARIDRLAPEVRRTLQIASVIGRTFSQSVLEQLLGPTVDVAAHIQTLIGADLIRPATDVEIDFTFLHALARDAAYETILLRQRRRYHRQVAEAIEVLYPDKLDEEAPRLAYHFVEARDFSRALRYCILAGESAARVYAHAEAIEHYGRAIELAQSLASTISNSQLTELYLRLGRIYELNGQYDEALNTYEALVTISNDHNDKSGELAALTAQIVIYSTPNSRMSAERGLELANRALQLAEETGSTEAEARVHWGLLLHYLNVDINPAQAIEHGELALALSRTSDLSELRAFILNDIGRAYGMAGRMDDAMRTLAAAQVQWRRLGNDPMLADALGVYSQGLFLSGQPEMAAEAAREGLAIAHRLGNSWSIAFNSGSLGFALLELGHISDATDSLRQAAEIGVVAQFNGPLAGIAVALAWAYEQLGVPSYSHEEMAGWFSDQSDSQFIMIMRTVWDAQELWFAGETQQAVKLISELSYADVVYDGPEVLIFVLPALAILIDAAEFGLALQFVDEQLEIMNRLSYTPYRAHHLHYRGLALHGLGPNAEALQSLNEARAVAHSQGARVGLWQLLADLIQLESDPAKQARYRDEAIDEINYLADHITDPAVREVFLSLPEVSRLLEGRQSIGT